MPDDPCWMCSHVVIDDLDGKCICEALEDDLAPSGGKPGIILLGGQKPNDNDALTLAIGASRRPGDPAEAGEGSAIDNGKK